MTRKKNKVPHISKKLKCPCLPSKSSPKFVYVIPVVAVDSIPDTP